MRSRDKLIHLREKRLKPMGVGSYPALISIPVMLALIILVGWLRLPQTASASFRPVEEDGLRPMAGWALPAFGRGADGRLETSLVYAEATWAELEPEEGVYDFEAFEEKNCLNEWWAEGKKVVFRLVTDRPGEAGHKDIPEWLVDKMGGELLAGSFYEAAEGGGFAPDYSNLIMREEHRRLIEALAERYNEHGGIAYIELGSLGWDGEWTVDLEDEGVGNLPVSTVSREYAWHYTNSFTDTLMLMRRPYKEAELLEVGLYNPDLGDFEATWDYIDMVEAGGYDDQINTDLIAMPDFYRISPSGAHIAAEIDLEKVLRESLPELSRQISESHLDYAVLESGTAGLSDEAIERLQMLEELIGYRIWLRSAEWDCSLRVGMRSKVHLRFRNDGASPMHAAWPVALALFDGEKLLHCEITELDASMILPGSTELTAWIDLPDRAEAGVYRLKLAILDPYTGEPAVRLMMAECDEQTMWTDLGEIRVIG